MSLLLLLAVAVVVAEAVSMAREDSRLELLQGSGLLRKLELRQPSIRCPYHSLKIGPPRSFLPLLSGLRIRGRPSSIRY